MSYNKFFGTLLLALFTFSFWQCSTIDRNAPIQVLLSQETVGYGAGSVHVDVRCASQWNLYLLNPEGGHADWASVQVDNGTGDRRGIILKFQKNTSEEERALKVVLTAGSKDVFCTLTQKGKPSVSPDPDPDPNPNPNPDPDPDPDPEPQPQPGDNRPANGQTQWLEMPGGHLVGGSGMYCVTHHADMDGRQQRNYTLLYDSDKYTSYWVAYPLCQRHMGRGRNEDWKYDPKIPSGKQTSVYHGYGNNLQTPHFSDNFYARGHQLPNADRSGVKAMQYQTYYSTNLTPQIHKGFNEDIWAKLEAATRYAVQDARATDTVYVVTGATFNKVGEQLPITEIRNNGRKENGEVDGCILPIPNYYWKVMLKVRRDGSGQITDAKTAAFWLPHEDLDGHNYSEYQTTVDQVEAWTGFDFFVNLSQELQQKSESMKDWYAFKNY